MVIECKLSSDLTQFSRKMRRTGNYRPVSLTSVLGMRVIEKHLKDSAVIGHNQHEFMKGKIWLPNLIFFYKVTHPVDQGKPADVIFLDFSKAFDTVLQYPSGENVQPTAGLTHPVMGEQLAHGSGTEGYSEWNDIRLVTCHLWGSMGLRLRASSL